jgi:hypothetical protein
VHLGLEAVPRNAEKEGRETAGAVVGARSAHFGRFLYARSRVTVFASNWVSQVRLTVPSITKSKCVYMQYVPERMSPN